MKHITIDKNSLHYRIAEHDRTADVPTDICAYSRLVFFKSLYYLLLTISTVCIIFLFTAILGDILGGLISSSVMGVWVFDKSTTIIMTCLTICAIFIIYLLYMAKISKLISKVFPPSGFTHNAYFAFKNKVCFKLDFKNGPTR